MTGGSLYQRYRRTKHWQRVRREALERAGFRCEHCERRNARLDIHHKSYERLGRETPWDIDVYCADCHKDRHKLGALHEEAAPTGPTREQLLVGLLCAHDEEGGSLLKLLDSDDQIEEARRLRGW